MIECHALMDVWNRAENEIPGHRRIQSIGDLINETVRVDVIFSGLIAALVGGAVGAAISAGTSLRLARRATQEKASEALWSYQRALRGFSNRKYVDAGYGDEQAFLSSDSFAAVVDAHAAAYQWSGYLPRPTRDRLFRQANLEIGEPPHEASIAAASASDLADALELQLDRRFPLRWRDRFGKLY